MLKTLKNLQKASMVKRQGKGFSDGIRKKTPAENAGGNRRGKS